MIERVLSAFIRYVSAFRNLGFKSALQIIFYSIFKNLNHDKVFKTKKFGKIFWNAERDRVINHFYTPQVEIYSPSNDIVIKSIIDLGANIGTETKRFSRLYPQANILSVEVEERNFEYLKKNLADVTTAVPFRAAIWNRKAYLKLVSKSIDSQSWSVQEVDQGKDYDVVGMTFNDIMKAFNISDVDILKVDIEGAELQLFDSSLSLWIDKVKCIIMECPDSDAPQTTRKIFKELEDSKFLFNTYIHGENLVLVRSDFDWKPRSISNY
jgi:FkbM family methyltransferase